MAFPSSCCGPEASYASDTHALTLEDVPDDVLVRCLSYLDQADRFKTAALVCKRWRLVCLAPVLLRSVSVTPGSGSRALLQLQALMEFLTAHSVYVHSLELGRLQSLGVEVYELVRGCLSACAAAGALRELRLKCGEAVDGLDWLPQLTALTLLESLNFNLMHEQPADLLDWRHLPLSDAAFVSLPEEAQLPATLTALRFDWSDEVPAQLPRLTSLARLQLWGDDFTGLDAVLPHLTRLTCLALQCNRGLAALPPSITALRRLRRLQHCCSSAAGAGSVLPPAPWLAGLEWVCLPWGTLEAGASHLAAATSLRHLCCFNLPHKASGVDGASRWRAFWADFVAVHLPLRCLTLETGDNPPTPQLFDAILWLRHRRPELLVRRLEYDCAFDEIATELELPAGPGSVSL